VVGDTAAQLTHLAGVDPDAPRVSGVYDAYASGARTTVSDRDFARRTSVLFPGIKDGVLDNLDFLRRAVTFMASRGIRQFLDLGSGAHRDNGVLAIARRFDSDVRIVCVDQDAVSVASNELAYEHDKLAIAVEADLREPGTILDRADVKNLLDWNQPIGVLLVAVTHFLAPKDNPREIIAAYVSAAAPGSYCAISHASIDAAPAEAQRQVTAFAEEYRRHDDLCSLYLRDRAEVLSLFGDLTMVSAAGPADKRRDTLGVDPASEVETDAAHALVHLPEWRPELPEVEISASLAYHCAWCGVGWKPRDSAGLGGP
jgi:hypothetical protein